jgi:hypothetical protein
MKTSKEIAKIVKMIISTFKEINGVKFAGIKEYTNNSGETANHVINVGFNYGNAVDKDLTALKSLTSEQIEEIAHNVSITIGANVCEENDVYSVIDEMIASFEKNKNSETASNASKGQSEAYEQITPGIKLHIESGEIHIYALGVSKKVLVKGTYKDVKHGQKWFIQNEIKKACNFSTAKYKNFKVTPDKFTTVNISGESYSIK